jgi:hypothetical protein
MQCGPGRALRQPGIAQIWRFVFGNCKEDGTIMDRQRCIEVFVEVARAGSFTGAARSLGMSKAAASGSQ